MGAPKLKPCPFCGGQARFSRGGADFSPHGWSAGCEYGHALSPDLRTKEAAAEWWNRRADLPAGYVILSPDEVRATQNALRYAREGFTVAGSMPLSDADTVEAIDAAIKALEARDG